MSTVLTPSPAARGRLLTVADLAAFPPALPSGPVLYELDNGRLVIMTPPGDIHGAVELNVAAQLKVQGEHRGFGRARSGDVGVVLWRGPDRVVGADAVFIANRSLPIVRSAEGYLETIPDLALEVRSPNDTQAENAAKVRDYLLAGVRVVWVADPEAQTVTVHRAGLEPQVLTVTDTLTIEDVIPGFRMAVADVFQV
jgi:Uma2 family endonuclease